MEKIKTALITGASSKIGASIARILSSDYNLVLHYNTGEEKINELYNELKDITNNEIMIIKCDLKDEEQIKNMVSIIVEKFAKIDVLVNNAAIQKDSSFKDKTKEDFQEIFDVNVIAPFLLSKYTSKYMIENKFGRIINISSTNGIDTYYPESMDYDASKAALISLTHNLSIQLAPYVTVNAIAPGWVNTDMNSLLDDEQIKKINDRILLKRFAHPDEVANLVKFLASEKSSYINNEIIRVDGGSFNEY